jgi:competence protein ComEC
MTAEDVPTGEAVPAVPAASADPEAPDAPPPDLRLIPAALAGWLGALVGTALPPATSLVVAVAGIAAAVLATVGCRGAAGRRRAVLAVTAAALACFGATVLAGAWRVHTLQSGPVSYLAADRAVGLAELVVTADPVPVKAAARSSNRAPSQVVVSMRLERFQAHGLDVRSHEPVVVVAPAVGWSDLLPSQRLLVDARLGPPDPGDDVAAWLRVLGGSRLVGSPSGLQRGAGVVRRRLRESTGGLGAAERGLVAGLVDGDTSQLPADVADEFKVAGLTHLSAVSGSNVAFVLAAVLVAARWIGLRARALPVVGVLGLGGFLVLARPEPSVLRATVMGLLVVAAMVRRGASGRVGLPALCAAVLVLVLVDPFVARTAGFTLSVLATAGLLVLAPGWRERLRQRLPSALADGVAVAAAAQLACTPILVLLAPQVSLVSVPANLLAAPAVPLATVLGVVVAVLGVTVPVLAPPVAWLAGVPAGWIVLVAHVMAGLPLATVAWPAGLLGAALVVVAVVALRLAWPWLSGHRRLVLGGGVAVSLFIASPLAPGGRWPPPGWIAVACDVGQGDALVLSASPGTAVVVDAGPDPAKVDTCLRRLGVSRIGLLVLTHFHADHVEGLPGVLDGRRVAEVEVSPLAEPPDEAARVRAWTRAAGVPVTVAVAGEQRAFGAVRWTVLWPSRIVRIDSVPNNASIVMRIQTHGIVLLATGDVEPPAQSALLTDPSQLRADVLKVPHHGSRYQDPAFIAAVGARFALISVGLGNDYGHPAASTITMLEDDGATVRRTDLDGSIALVGPPDNLHLETLGPSP